MGDILTLAAGPVPFRYWPELAIPLATYLVAAIPFALLIGRLHGVDLRRVGSGNVGAGNLTRAVGVRAGLTAGLLDGLKGLIPVQVAGRLGLGAGVIAVTGLAAVVGHNWSIWLRGRSGRGLATSAGVLWGIDPVLLIWTIGWSLVGWKLGGGIGGFLGWSLLPIVAVGLGRPSPAVLVTTGLATLMVARRVQGNPGRRPGLYAAWHRVVFDRDAESESAGAEEAARP